MKAWGCFIYTTLFLIVTFSLWLISDGIIGKIATIIIACMWIYGIILYIIHGEEYKEQESYFTGDDYIACKIGEWISRR